MQLWRVFLQHDDTGRNSECVVEAEDYGHAARQAQRQYGQRWFAYAVKPEPDDLVSVKSAIIAGLRLNGHIIRPSCNF